MNDTLTKHDQAVLAVLHYAGLEKWARAQAINQVVAPSLGKKLVDGVSDYGNRLMGSFSAPGKMRDLGTQYDAAAANHGSLVANRQNLNVRGQARADEFHQLKAQHTADQADAARWEGMRTSTELAESKRLTDQVEDQRWAMQGLQKQYRGMGQQVSDSERGMAGMADQYAQQQRNLTTGVRTAGGVAAAGGASVAGGVMYNKRRKEQEQQREQAARPWYQRAQDSFRNSR